MAISNEAAKLFRRTVRRLAAQYLGRKITHANYVAAVRGAAVTAGIADAKRPTRDERVLNALAWGRGQMPPGELPARLEPYFRRFDSGDISVDTFGEEVRRLLHHFVTSPPPGNAATLVRVGDRRSAFSATTTRTVGCVSATQQPESDAIQSDRAHEPSRYAVFSECPHCAGEMRTEHAHYRCAGCGWRDSCCD